MDNEASNVLKQTMLKYKINYQLTPPHMHRINAAERAIHTFKNHYLAGLASVDPSFPINKWDRLLPQAEITINLLHTSRLNPNLSAYAILHGNYNFNKSPMTPPGTKMITHRKQIQHASWDFHGDDGFYIGPAVEHYRCVQCLVTSTRRVRISDIVQFFPHATPFLQVSLNSRLLTALDEIISTLHSPNFHHLNPSLKFDNTTKLAIQIIANMLHRMIPKPDLPSPKQIPILQHPVANKILSHVSNDNSVRLPRVVKKSKLHPHTKLKRQANQVTAARPISDVIINRLLHI